MLETITPITRAKAQLMHSREADLRQQSPSPILTLFSYKKCCIEINMTLKQAYSSEYQGVQGAFKDSMIHWILQFTLLIAFRCVLHRCESQEIHCWKLYISLSIINNNIHCNNIWHKVKGREHEYSEPLSQIGALSFNSCQSSQY